MYRHQQPLVQLERGSAHERGGRRWGAGQTSIVNGLPLPWPERVEKKAT